MKKLLLFFCCCTLLMNCGKEIDCCVLPIETFSFNGTGDGCSNFYVYKEMPENGLHLYVSGDRAALELDSTEKEFSLDANSLKVQIHQFKAEIGNYACDDVANDQGEIVDTWNATGGQVFIQITEDSISVQPWEMTFKMTVKLKDIELENTEKGPAILPDEVFEDVFVGWLPG